MIILLPVKAASKGRIAMPALGEQTNWQIQPACSRRFNESCPLAHGTVAAVMQCMPGKARCPVLFYT
jgi:hypothetical protein